ASAQRIRRSSLRPGACSAIVAGSAAASTGSTSIATTRAPASSRPRVRDPSPGPISTTVSPGCTPEVRTILRTVEGSITKFWPSVLVGRSPSSWARRRTVAAVSSRGPGLVGSAEVTPLSLEDIAGYSPHGRSRADLSLASRRPRACPSPASRRPLAGLYHRWFEPACARSIPGCTNGRCGYRLHRFTPGGRREAGGREIGRRRAGGEKKTVAARRTMPPRRNRLRLQSALSRALRVPSRPLTAGPSEQVAQSRPLRADRSQQAELGGACGPLAPAAALLQGLCTLRLLGRRGVRGDTGSAHRVPGVGGELVEAVVRAGRVHCVRVTAGLTFGQLGPHATARGATAGVTGVTGITGVLRSAGLL